MGYTPRLNMTWSLGMTYNFVGCAKKEGLECVIVTCQLNSLIISKIRVKIFKSFKRKNLFMFLNDVFH